MPIPLPTMPHMLCKVSIESFKSIGPRIDLELRPLTVLIGPNGAGKSAILQALALVQRRYLRLTSDKDYQRLLGISSWSELRNTRLYRPPNLTLVYEINVDRYPELRPRLFDLLDSIRRVHSATMLKALRDFRLEGELDSEVRSLRLTLTIPSLEAYLQTQSEPPELSPIPAELFVYVHTSKGFVELRLPPVVDYQYSNVPEVKKLVESAIELRTVINHRLLPKLLGRVLYLSHLRGFIEYSKSSITVEALRHRYVGAFGEYALDVIAATYESYDMHHRYVLASELQRLASYIGLDSLCGGFDIETKAHTVTYSDLGAILRVSQAGAGSRQLLPIITQLAISMSGDVVLIEEPELSLHAELQVRLAEIFAGAICRGIQLVITTHSTYIVMSIPDIVENIRKRYSIDAKVDDLVALYEVYRDEEGFTRVRRIELDEYGYPLELPSIAKVEEKIWDKWFSRHSRES